MAHHASGGVALEEVRAVLQRAGEALRALGEGEGEVELGGELARRKGAQGEARELQVAHGGVLEGEHHLEERRAAQVARRPQLLDELLEGDVLVGEGTEGGFAHLVQQLAEGGDTRRGEHAGRGC